MSQYPLQPFVDKGVQIGPESHLLNETPSLVAGYRAIQLTDRARGRQILTDGTEISSSLSVSNGGIYFTEVFSLPLPIGNYFYHQDSDLDETSILLFSTDQPATLPVTAYYETRGNKLKSYMFNIYNYGKGIFNGGGTIAITHNYPDTITDIIVLCQAKDGSTVSYVVSGTTVTLTGTVGVECSFMLIAVPA